MSLSENNTVDRPCWWFGVNNVKSVVRKNAHITYPAIALLLNAEVEEIAWKCGGTSGSGKHYEQMRKGDKLVFWMGDGEYENWGIIGFGFIKEIDTRELILGKLLETS